MSLTFTPPAKLSPSQYHRASSCPYQFLLAKTPEARALAGIGGSGGAAAVGTIVHALLEQSATTDLSSSAVFEAAWQQQLAQQEARLLKQGSTHLLPLAYRARGYAVTKLLLQWYLVAQLPLAPVPPGSSLPFGAEKTLTDSSGHISGIADLVRVGPTGPELVDYKTGPIFVYSNEEEAEIKPAYVQQLHLYAALFFEQTGQWPAQLLLADLSGQEHAVVFTPATCLQLLTDAQQLLAQMVSAVADDDPESLAQPSLAQCQYCQVRPLCRPFATWNAQQGS